MAMLRTLWFCLAAAVEFTGGDVTIPQQFHSFWNVVELNQEDPRIAVLVGNERPQICIAQGVVHCCGPGQIGLCIALVRVDPETQVKKKPF